jgi:RecB family exonuclease
MPAALRAVRTIPIDQPFLRVLAEYIADRHKSSFPDLSRLLIIFPAQRDKLYVRRYLLEAFKATAVIPPTMMTVSELMASIYETAGGRTALMLNPIERSFFLKEVIDAHKVEFWQDVPFLRFISIGDRLLTFFDELAQEHVTIDDIEKSVEAGHFPEKYVTDELPIMKQIYRAYRNRLKRARYCDAIDMYTTVYEHFDPKQFKEYTHITVAGLVALTVVEVAVIRKILASLPAELVLHSDHTIITQPLDTDHPLYAHSRLMQALGIGQASAIGTGVRHDPALIHARRLESISQQTLYLKECLISALTRYEPSRIAVILTDETIVNTVTETLRTAGIEYNLSAGRALSQSTLFCFLHLLRDTAASRCHFRELFAFLRHPLVKNAIIDGTPLRKHIYELERVMVKHRDNYFDAERYSTDFAQLSGFISECVSAIQEQCAFTEYVRRITDLLNRVITYNADILTTNRPDIKALIEELDTLAQLRIDEKHASGVDMLDFMLSLMKHARYTSYGDPMRGVQIIGVLEARNLDFDCVVLPSLNEGVFPARSEKDLFINQSVRREVGMPYDKERENLFYYYFTELTSGKKEVYLSYVEEETRDVRSRFIDFLVDRGTAVVDETKVRLENTALEHPLRQVTKDAHVFNRLRAVVSSKGLSPTHVRDYRQCPYRFYLKYIVRIQESEDIVEEPGAREWGNAMHRALHYFYKYDMPDGYTEKDMDNARALLDKRFVAAIRSEVARVPKKVIAFDTELYRRRIEQVLRFDARRFSEGFRVVTERLETYLNTNVMIGDVQVKLFGRADRVDKKDTMYYVIDYKSKAPAKQYYTIGPDFEEFQLPLYALMMTDRTHENIGGLAYYDVSRTVRFVQVADEETVVTYLDQFRKEILIPTLTELLNADVPFSQTGDPARCRYCMYRDTCGVTDV